MNKIYLLLGSNIGDSRQQLAIALKHVEKSIGQILRYSHIYQTAAWGKTDQADFLNQVIVVETNLTAGQTMHSILAIEKYMGRIRSEKNAPRMIDIDILFFNKEIIWQNNLSI